MGFLAKLSQYPMYIPNSLSLNLIYDCIRDGTGRDFHDPTRPVQLEI